MTRTQHPTRDSGVSVLVGGAAVTLALGAVASLVGYAVDGRPAAWGALVGTLVVVVVCATGSLLVNAVAGLLPAASLMFALLTYTLQVLVLLVVLLALDRSALLGSALDRGWLGGAAIGATLVWLGILILFTVRRRIPVYDLPASEAPEAAVAPGAGRPRSVEGGER